MITVIVPCAGLGTRLDLPFPKELAPAPGGRVIMDDLLDLVEPLGADARLLLLVNDDRRPTVHYVCRRLRSTGIAVAWQPEDVHTMTEAVVRLRPWFSEVVVVALPDQSYTVDPNVPEPMAELAARARENSFAFLCAQRDPQTLMDDGAVRLERDASGRMVVGGYEDKPSDPAAYNAAWAAFAWSGRAGEHGLHLVDASTRRLNEGPVDAAPIRGAGVVLLNAFEDLGVWTRYAALWRGAS